MDEVNGATQAEMAIRLSDNVRDLVRKHLQDALEDFSFMTSLNSFPLSQAIMRHINENERGFQQAVKNVIVAQMNKY